MCSIEGFTGPQPFTIEDYTKFNKDRGPDDTNHWDDGIVHLGHNLLAIAPQPKNKSQPYETDRGNVLCYNGEIFGLDQQVYDTEWLANRIEQKGVQSLKHNVNGMWAFSWYDIEKKKLYLVRDHFGVKPLFTNTTPNPKNAGTRNDADVVILNDIAKKVMNEKGVPYNDIYGFVKSQEDYPRLYLHPRAENNCHFDQLGRKLLGENIAQFILDNMENG